MLYDDEYRRDAMFHAITHKANSWSHEDEVRALHQRPGILEYPRGMLASILIGCAGEEENVIWLQRLLEDNGLEVPVYRVGLRADTFDLERYPI